MVADVKVEQASPAIGSRNGHGDIISATPKKHHLFEQSTQYNHWRFTQQGVDEMRIRANKEAIAAIKAHVEEERQLRLAQGMSVDDLSTEMEFLAPKDEQRLQRYYEGMIKHIYTHWKLKSEMWATALVYFKRFYLENTTMDFHPKDIMLTCIFLARKTDNILLPADEFAKAVAPTAKPIALANEALVCQSLRFHFTVHHPYRPCLGYFYDMQAATDNMDKLSQTYEAAIKIIDTLMHTDVCFLYQPSQIALAAMRIAALNEGYDFESYVAFKFLSKPETKEKYETTLLPMLQSIEKIFNEDPRCADVERTEATAIDRKLKKCKDPMKDPTSLLFKKRHQEAEQGGNDDDDDDDDDDDGGDSSASRSAKRTKLEDSVGPQSGAPAV